MLAKVADARSAELDVRVASFALSNRTTALASGRSDELWLSSNLLASSRALRRPSTRRSRTTVGQDLRTTTSNRARTRIIKFELTVWVVFICFVWVESIVDRTIAWAIPFYSQIKIVVLLFLWTLKRAGSQIVFKQIKRYMRRYEGPIDAVGYALGQVIDVLIAALVFLPSLLWAKWVASRQPDVRPGQSTRCCKAQLIEDNIFFSLQVPSILAGLNSPRRGPMANRLAAAVQKSTSTATVDSSNKIKITAQTVIVPVPPIAPSARLKRIVPCPAIAESRLKPSSSTSSAIEQRWLSMPTSSRAVPSTSSCSSLYPSLPSVSPLPVPAQPTVPALRQSTSRPRVISDRQKGKQRTTEEVSDAIPPEAPSLIEPTPRSPSETPRKKTSRRHSSSRKSTPRRSVPTDESLNAVEDAQVDIQVEEPVQVDTPRAFPVQSSVFPQTPAPPGAFVSTPFANKSLGSTARQQASSALKGLADDLLGLGDDLKPIAASPLASRTGGQLNGKGLVSGASKRFGGSVWQKQLEATKASEEEQGTEMVGDRRKRKALRAPSTEPAPPATKRRAASSLSSSTSSRQVGTSDTLLASTRCRPSALSSSISVASRSTRMRVRVGEDSSILSKSTSAASTSKVPSLKASAKELLSPPTALSRTAHSGLSSSTTATVPKRRAKRVLGRGASVDVEDEQIEMDGVPVVKRRR
ncbi:BQ2448_3867 [Microbotryum intermedium]|uniref:BQ2448_3867 protein n=1 Tax=Microbotryum intermedium TaxID=269621 RepID=A0A238FET4_9BASI|nr:BQ2448_3867 [Microbotryum intermedium]